MTKKEILEHVLDIIYEQLYVEEINLEYIDQRNKELGDKESYDYQMIKSKAMQGIDYHMRRVNIVKNMIKKL